VKPGVLVDMDGPLADFDRLFFGRCEANGWEMDCALATQSARFATDHVIDPDHKKLARAMVDAAGWFADLPLVEGAAEGLNRLAEVAEVWICTKPLEVNPTCRDDKGRWVAKHLGPEWERRLIITPDKSMVRGDILLDDAPSLGWFSRASWVPIMFRTPWNRAGSPWEGLPSWSWTDPLDDLLIHAGR
jgi:5'-nucleotidase